MVPRATGPSAERGYHHGHLREALVDAGVALARAGGPAAVQLRAVTREAGVSHNAAYRHFASQEDLVAAVAQRCMKQLSLLMIERMDQVTARDAVQRAHDRLEAIGRAYIDFARAEPGWFRTAFSSARSHAGEEPPAEVHPDDTTGTDDTEDTDGVPGPYEILNACLDDLVEVGAMTADARVGAEYAAWSSVHGLSSLLLDGPLRDLPEPEVEHAINAVLGESSHGME